MAPSAWECSDPNSPPLCPACQEHVRQRPQEIPGYLIVGKLGEGGMGVVHLALRTADWSVVALKTIIPAVAGSKKDIERFLREASILKELSHPNIVAFQDMGESNGHPYFVMEFVRGQDAHHLLKTHGPMPICRAVGLVCQLLDALEYAHANGFVHRDIKPGNLLITQLDGREVARLADFGLARFYQASRLSGLTLNGKPGGTLAFMPPEQVYYFRDAKPPADQYSAAATLYNLLTDRFVFDFEEGGPHALHMILNEEPVPIQARRQDIPKKLAEILHRALAKEPANRFADVKAMRMALVEYCR